MTTLGFTFLKTRRDFLVIIVLCFVCAVTSMVYSLQAPIYPREAEAKGASSTEYGLVLGSYELVVLVMSPIASNLILRVGPWTVFSVSAVITGSTVVSFGFLGFVYDRVLFIGLSFLLRILEAVGASAVVMCIYALLTEQFPEGTAEAIGVVEIAFGAGLSVGPVFGSLLYSVGEPGGSISFLLPFLVIGSLHFCSAILTFCVLRTGKSESNNKAGDEKKGKQLSFLQLIKMPSILYFQFIVMMGCSNFGFQNALLATHLEEAGLTTAWISTVFLLFGVIYTFSCPFVGKYANKMKEPIWLAQFATILFVIAFGLFAISARGIWTVPLTCVAVTMTGIGLGNTIMTGYVLCLQDAAKRGFDDDKSVSAQVSALWLSAISLGGFIGPSAAGFFFEQWGFFYAAIIFLVVNFLLALTIPLFQILSQQMDSPKKPSEGKGVPTLTKY